MSRKGLEDAGEEDAMASQVLEIIGGITPEALRSLKEAEGRDAWSVEEGDDSVFYSDEEVKANPACVSGGDGNLNGTAAGTSVRQGGGDASADGITDSKISEMIIMTAQDEELQTAATAQISQTEVETPAAEINPASASTAADSQPEAEQKIAEEDDHPTEPNQRDLEPFCASKEESLTRRSGEQEAPDKESTLHGTGRSARDPSPGYSTLPLPGKSDPQKSFDHLTASKYGTVSYRKIRRGNTRQKIEEFEYMIMNL